MYQYKQETTLHKARRDYKYGDSRLAVSIRIQGAEKVWKRKFHSGIPRENNPNS